MRNFLRKGNNSNRGQHLVRWEKVIHPTEDGGLGIRSIKDKNKALLEKWIWRYHVEESSLWRIVFFFFFFFLG